MGKAVDADKTGCHLSSKAMKFFCVHIQELLRYLNSAARPTWHGKDNNNKCIHRCVTSQDDARHIAKTPIARRTSYSKSMPRLQRYNMCSTRR